LLPVSGNKCNKFGGGAAPAAHLSQLVPVSGNRCNTFGVGAASMGGWRSR